MACDPSVLLSLPEALVVSLAPCAPAALFFPWCAPPSSRTTTLWLAQASRSSFHGTHSTAPGGHPVAAALAKAKMDPRMAEDIIAGCGGRRASSSLPAAFTKTRGGPYKSNARFKGATMRATKAVDDMDKELALLMAQARKKMPHLHRELYNQLCLYSAKNCSEKRTSVYC